MTDRKAALKKRTFKKQDRKRWEKIFQTDMMSSKDSVEDSVEDWEDLPGSTNPVESINHQGIPENQKLVSLKALVEHIYLEDRRQVVLEVATAANITITYQVKPR